MLVEQAQRLVDRVGRARLPAWSGPLLGRHRDHLIAERAAQPPGGRQMAVEAVALVLGEHANPPDPAVGQVGQREIDQPVDTSERNCRLGPLCRQRRQPPPGRPRQDNAKNTLAPHPRTPCRAPAASMRFPSSEPTQPREPACVTLRPVHPIQKRPVEASSVEYGWSVRRSGRLLLTGVSAAALALVAACGTQHGTSSLPLSGPSSSPAGPSASEPTAKPSVPECPEVPGVVAATPCVSVGAEQNQQANQTFNSRIPLPAAVAAEAAPVIRRIQESLEKLTTAQRMNESDIRSALLAGGMQSTDLVLLDNSPSSTPAAFGGYVRSIPARRSARGAPSA